MVMGRPGKEGPWGREGRMQEIEPNFTTHNLFLCRAMPHNLFLRRAMPHSPLPKPQFTSLFQQSPGTRRSDNRATVATTIGSAEVDPVIASYLTNVRLILKPTCGCLN